MKSTLSESDRAAWTDAYSLHEKYQDIDDRDVSWIKFANELVLLAARHEGKSRRLAEALFLAVYEYLGEEQKRKEDAARLEPEQVTMEGIPWN